MLKTRGFEGYCIMEFSKRLDLFGDEIFAALNERKVALEAQGRTIYNLSVGTPDFAPAEHIRKAMMDAAADPQNWKYSLRDLPELLDAVCGYYKRRFGVEITPDQVASCAGSQEGVGHIGMVLCDEGDTRSRGNCTGKPACWAASWAWSSVLWCSRSSSGTPTR